MTLIRALTPGRTLACAVGAVALFNTLSALTLPVIERRPSTGAVGVWLGLLCAHVIVYWAGESIRTHYGLVIYAAAQAILLSGIIVSGMPTPVALGLLMAGTAELVLLARGRWGALPITLGATALYLLAGLSTAGLYGAMTAGLLLAVTGTVAHAFLALMRRPVPAPVGAIQAPAVRVAGAGRWELSPRELDVLGELVRGARNGEIAASLGISERTVKAHLTHIYQKLGVDSRAGAVATALGRGLI